MGKTVPEGGFRLCTKSHEEVAEKEYADYSYAREIAGRFLANKGAAVSLVIIATIVVMAIIAPMVSSYAYDDVQTQYNNLPPRIPGLEQVGIFDGTSDGVNLYAQKGASDQYHLFGTDSLGRDIWTRVWSGTRISLTIALWAVIIDVFIGVAYGLVSGYFGGKVDIVLQRITEVLSSIPQLVIVTLMLVVMRLLNGECMLEGDQGELLYFQLESDLRQKMFSGEYGIGTRIPTEMELCQKYGVSRITVRRAIQDLVEEGVLERLRGHGTYVSVPKHVIGQSAACKRGFSSFADEGTPTSRIVLEKGMVNADASVSSWLGIPLGSKVQRMQLLWLAYVVLVHPSDGFTDYRILLFQIPLLNAVFLPLLSCVVSSTECDVETRGNMFKSLLTMQRAGALFWIKWLFSAGLMAAVVTLQTVVLTILAGAGGLDAIPAGELVVYWVSTFAVCVFCTSLAQALSLLTRSQFAPMVVGVALSFFGLFSMDGIDTCARITARWPGVHVLILTTYDQDDYALGGLSAGASGFLLKDVRTSDLVAAVRSVAAGDAVLTPRITREVVGRSVDGMSRDEESLRFAAAFRALTPREREVCRLVADGLSNAEVAEQLTVEPASVKRSVTRILAKLGLRDRVQIAVRWYKAGIA